MLNEITVIFKQFSRQQLGRMAIGASCFERAVAWPDPQMDCCTASWEESTGRSPTRISTEASCNAGKLNLLSEDVWKKLSGCRHAARFMGLVSLIR